MLAYLVGLVGRGTVIFHILRPIHCDADSDYLLSTLCSGILPSFVHRAPCWDSAGFHLTLNRLDAGISVVGVDDIRHHESSSIQLIQFGSGPGHSSLTLGQLDIPRHVIGNRHLER